MSNICIFSLNLEKIYTWQKIFTQTCLWCLWQIWGMERCSRQPSSGWGSPILVDWIELADKSVFRILRTRACWYTHSNILRGHQYSWCVQLQARDEYRKPREILNHHPENYHCHRKTSFQPVKRQYRAPLSIYWQNTHSSVHHESTRDQMMIIWYAPSLRTI